MSQVKNIIIYIKIFFFVIYNMSYKFDDIWLDNDSFLHNLYFLMNIFFLYNIYTMFHKKRIKLITKMDLESNKVEDLLYIVYNI